MVNLIPCVIFVCLLLFACVSVGGVAAHDDVSNSEFLRLFKTVNFSVTCPRNALLNSSVSDIVRGCDHLGKENELGRQTYETNSLLCVAYYDMNVRLCNISLSNKKLQIPSDSVEYNELLSTMNNENLLANFCRDINEALNVAEPVVLAKNDTSILNGQFLAKEKVCRKVCYNFDESDVLPICKFILWGNSMINSVLREQKKVMQPVVDPNESAIAKSEPLKPKNVAISQPLITSNITAAVDNNEASKHFIENVEKKVILNKSTSAMPASGAQQPQLPVQNQSNPALEKEHNVPLKVDQSHNGHLLPESNKQANNVNTNDQTNKAANPDIEVGDETEDFGDSNNNESQLDDNQELGFDAQTPPEAKKENEVIGNIQSSSGHKVTADVKEESEEDKLEETQVKSDDFEDVHNPVVFSKNVYVNPSEGHFYTIFFTMVILSVVLYVAYHNKNKILGLIIEGRHKSETRRSSSGPAYRRLDNLEQVVSSGVKTPPSNVIY